VNFVLKKKDGGIINLHILRKWNMKLNTYDDDDYAMHICGGIVAKRKRSF
jgi:hypothetical protein